MLLKWRDECSAEFFEDPGHFIQHIVGDVVATSDAGDEVIAGRFGIFYIDIAGAINEGMPVFDVMDFCDTTSRYYGALFDGSHEFNKAVKMATRDDLPEMNLLVLDRLELLPQFRGRGRGLKILRQMIHRFSPGAGIVAMNPFPLQFERTKAELEASDWKRRMGLHEMPRRGKTEATEKLRQHYAQLGFRRIGRSTYMVRSTAAPLPRID